MTATTTMMGVGGGGGGLNAILFTKLGILQRPLSPVMNNVYATLLTILYVKVVLEFGSYLRARYDVPEMSRKFVHLAACSFVIFWPLFDIGHWGWRLNVTVPVVMSLRLLYKVSGDAFPSPPPPPRFMHDE